MMNKLYPISHPHEIDHKSRPISEYILRNELDDVLGFYQRC